MGDDNKRDAEAGGAVVPFPFSRVSPTHASSRDSPVVYGAFAAKLGLPREQTTGHWCSRCNMIWYGYLLEVACPSCGNRHG